MERATANEVSSAYESTTFEKDGSFQVDKPVGALSISPCGRDVVLASRQGLHIVDLDSPWSPPRHLPHLTPWEVADVQWSPFATRDFWVVSTSNQKALVWNLAMSRPEASIEHVLHAHSRAITDINFSAHHPDILATCAVDSFVHCWDLRHPVRPALSFCDWFAGATQVKWNRQDPHVVASAHDKVLRIWDDRKGAHPLRSIEAHDTKIYGIDWNRVKRHGLVTCSLDKTVKIWDTLDESDEPQRVIETSFPVWRARHTPFGWGLLVMPQRGDNDLHLYNRRVQDDSGKANSCSLVRRFEGHDEQVKEFLWRPRGEISDGIDHREFQLVTWGNDKKLRLHRMKASDLADVGYEKGSQVHPRLVSTRQNAPYKTFREDTGKSANLHRPLSSIGEAVKNPDFGVSFGQSTARTLVPSPSVALSGWMSSGFIGSKPGVRSKGASRKDLDPISWMKGVKIGKKDGSMDAGIGANSHSHTKTTEDFESLGEEITHVGSKFSKVEFLHVDVHHRVVRFSLHGPWSAKEATTYLNCQLDFPKDYPKGAIPTLNIEKTAAIDEETLQNLRESVKTICEAFLEHQRSSLEAVVRFLHGDQSAEDLIAWTKEDAEMSAYDFVERGEGSSSDDDEVDLDEFADGDQEDFGLTGSGILNASSANANVPLPKSCGAAWSKDGRLVCFFMPPEDSAHSIIGSLGLSNSGLFPKSKLKTIQGLGKFRPPRSSNKSKSSSLATFESDESIESSSDSSDYSSTASSVSSRRPSSHERFIGTNQTFRADIFGSSKLDRLLDETQRSTASGSLGRVAGDRSKSTVSIKDFEKLLPARKVLAEQYELCGPTACANNAKVARAEGLDDISDIWTILDFIMREEVPLDGLISASLVSSLRSSQNPWHGGSNKGVVSWGQHPLGNADFLGSIFDYAAKLSDVQTLATMACVLTPRPSPALFNSSAPSTAQAKKPEQSRKAESQPSIETPALQMAKSLLNPKHVSSSLEATKPNTRLRSSFEQALQDRMSAKLDTKSLSSSFGAAASEAVVSAASDHTPPLSYKLGRQSFDRADSALQGLSASPEKTRWSQRSSSNLANAFASSIPKAFSFSVSASSSPPNHDVRKRSSPFGSYKGSYIQNALTRNTTFSRSGSNAEEYKDYQAFNKQEKLNRERRSSVRGRDGTMTVTLSDPRKFHVDGYSGFRLLDPKVILLWESYMEHYANLLLMWGMPVERSEVLQYIQSPFDQKAKIDAKFREGPFFYLDKFMAEEFETTKEKEISLLSYCPSCKKGLDLNKKKRPVRCTFCQAQVRPIQCILCHELIFGRASPCLTCGHVMHSACRQLLADEGSELLASCIACSDCECITILDVKVELGQVETPRKTASGLANRRSSNNGGDRLEYPLFPSYTKKDKAYESLAQNLRGKYLKSKAVH